MINLAHSGGGEWWKTVKTNKGYQKKGQKEEGIKKRYEERLIYQTNDIQTIYISNTIKLCKKKSCLMKET